MKSLFLLILFCLGIYNGYSQQANCVGSSDEDYGIRLQTGLIGFEYYNPIKGYEGEQYFNKLTLGEVMMSNGDVIKDISLRYDKYQDELLWIRESDFTIGVLSKNSVAGFRLFVDKNKSALLASFVKMKITLPLIGSTDAFLQVLVSGDLSLYVYRNVNIISAKDYALNDNTRYFISCAGQLYPLTLRRKSLLNIPAIQKTEMRAILRQNQIAIRNNEFELLRAIDLYNEKHKKPGDH